MEDGAGRRMEGEGGNDPRVNLGCPAPPFYVCTVDHGTVSSQSVNGRRPQKEIQIRGGLSWSGGHTAVPLRASPRESSSLDRWRTVTRGEPSLGARQNPELLPRLVPLVD